MFRPTSTALITTIALTVALTFAACGGGGDGDGGSTSPGATSTPAPSGSTPLPAAATPAPSEADRATEAAKAILGGFVDPACTPSPETPVCVIPDLTGGTPQQGTAAFTTNEYQGGGAVEFLGLTPQGEWRFWFGTQDITYQMTVLPGDMRVCAGGEGLNVRESPDRSSESLTLLNDGTVINVDRFVLTEPGSRSPTTGVQAGFGWYHLTSPQEGWAYSRYLSAASLGDCSVHDTQVQN